MIRRAALLALVWLLALGAVESVLPSGLGRLPIRDARAQASPPIEVRVAAQRLANGYTEFALQVVDRVTGQPGSRLLPNPRFLPRATAPGSWRVSGALELPGGYTVRIVARNLGDGRVEVGMQELASDSSWAERTLPHQRLLPANPPIRDWLVTSEVTFPQAAYVPVTNARGRFSYTGYYDSTVFGGVIGSELRSASQTGDAQLSLLCQYGLSLSLLSLPESDAEQVDVTLAFSSGITTTSTWRRYAPTILQSPDPWADIRRLQQAKSVAVHIPALLSAAQEFDLTGMFNTPIQGNFDHCGSYVAGEIHELPPPIRSYERGSLTTFNGDSSEATWERWPEPARLSRVVLKERLARLPGDGDADNLVSMLFHMSCDRRGLVVHLSGSALDEAIEHAEGGDPSVQLSLDGEPLLELPWQSGQGIVYPRDARGVLTAVRQGARFEVSLEPDGVHTFAFDLSVLFSSPAQISFDECIGHPVRTDPLPNNNVGQGRAGMLSWWTELVLDEQSLWVGEPFAHQQLRITCGLDGIAVDLTNVGASQAVFLRGWPAEIEVTWWTEVESAMEVWEVWDLELHNRRFALSPAEDRDFYQRIRGAKTLNIDVPTEPHPVTLTFDFEESGVWDTPAAADLDACDH